MDRTATTLLRRALSTVTDRRTLWVCYADTGTVRRRLASLAQQVRRALDDEYLPQLVLPRGERVRHGFWFMRFESEEAARAARAALRDRTFETECGMLRGALAMATGTRGGDARRAAARRRRRRRRRGWPSAAPSTARSSASRSAPQLGPGCPSARLTARRPPRPRASHSTARRRAKPAVFVRHRTQLAARPVPIDGRRAATPPRSPAGGSASAVGGASARYG